MSPSPHEPACTLGPCQVLPEPSLLTGISLSYTKSVSYLSPSSDTWYFLPPASCVFLDNWQPLWASGVRKMGMESLQPGPAFTSSRAAVSTKRAVGGEHLVSYELYLPWEYSLRAHAPYLDQIPLLTPEWAQQS